jgi:uncharacterized membrane protein HdeD (DUF308 family)
MAYQAAPTEGLREVTELWWPWLVVSLVSAAVGVVALVYPDKTLEVLAILFGINLLILGIVQLGAGLAGDRGHRMAGVLLGALAIVAGLIVIRHPGGSLTVLALGIGIYLVVAGSLQLVSAMETAEARGLLIAVGLFDLAAGIVIVAWPDFGVKTLGVVVGLVFLIRALTGGATALALRRAAAHT